MQSAEDATLAAIDEYLGGTENALSVPMTTINKAISEVVENNAKTVKRLTERILRAADKESVGIDNQLDRVYTGLLSGVDSWLGDTHFLLSQLASKGGLTEIGAPLESALEKEVADAPNLVYGATLVLAVKEAVPYFKELVAVLREIRDAIAKAPLTGDTPKYDTAFAVPEINVVIPADPEVMV